MPFSDKLPKPGELVAGAYDFAEQLLASQRKFAEDVLQATAPLFYGDTASAARKTAPRPSKARSVRRAAAGPPPVAAGRPTRRTAARQGPPCGVLLSIVSASASCGCGTGR